MAISYDTEPRWTRRDLNRMNDAMLAKLRQHHKSGTGEIAVMPAHRFTRLSLTRLSPGYGADMTVAA